MEGKGAGRAIHRTSEPSFSTYQRRLYQVEHTIYIRCPFSTSPVRCFGHFVFVSVLLLSRHPSCSVIFPFFFFVRDDLLRPIYGFQTLQSRSHGIPRAREEPSNEAQNCIVLVFSKCLLRKAVIAMLHFGFK